MRPTPGTSHGSRIDLAAFAGGARERGRQIVHRHIGEPALAGLLVVAVHLEMPGDRFLAHLGDPVGRRRRPAPSPRRSSRASRRRSASPPRRRASSVRSSRSCRSSPCRSSRFAAEHHTACAILKTELLQFFRRAARPRLVGRQREAVAQAEPADHEAHREARDRAGRIRNAERAARRRTRPRPRARP